MIPLDGEMMRMVGQKFRIHFIDPIHAGHARTAAQFTSQRDELIHSANRIDFDAPVEQISDVSGDAQLRRHALDEKTEPHALYGARYVKSLGQSLPGKIPCCDFIAAAARL